VEYFKRDSNRIRDLEKVHQELINES